ncbi:hypothetical protein [Chlorogloea sp. CCALA 695]|uniref:hypothetical protein n=1 Tax=Chlorogloea sp. CCALA 695 TaxID=2107693 RepID=UPI000D048E3C|nr:hypothetical protein [Chlorogloea sp. CCALA 695]PSB27471.1 hypothetical protein C7B70_22475 [Chlorogloea sp. CCALA 695]
MDFGNNLNWDLALRTTLSASPAPNETRGYFPIPPKTILLDRYILAIGASSVKAKPNWRLAGFVSPRLLFSPSSTSEYIAAVQSEKGQAILLNQLTLVRFTDFGVTPYVMEISIPSWLQQLSLEIWKYQGT